MKLCVSMMASLGLIGGTCLMTLAPADAAPAVASTTHHPSMAVGVTTPEKPVPVHSVSLLQEALDSTGANLKIDGVWGPRTEAAVRDYQRNHGLRVTGRIDQTTRAQLDPIG
jgi:peptidoglycan hydrolase-like protein with peptidoglycan-binding domain